MYLLVYHSANESEASFHTLSLLVCSVISLVSPLGLTVSVFYPVYAVSFLSQYSRISNILSNYTLTADSNIIHVSI